MSEECRNVTEQDDFLVLLSCCIGVIGGAGVVFLLCSKLPAAPTRSVMLASRAKAKTTSSDKSKAAKELLAKAPSILHDVDDAVIFRNGEAREIASFEACGKCRVNVLSSFLACSDSILTEFTYDYLIVKQN